MNPFSTIFKVDEPAEKSQVKRMLVTCFVFLSGMPTCSNYGAQEALSFLGDTISFVYWAQTLQLGSITTVRHKNGFKHQKGKLWMCGLCHGLPGAQNDRSRANIMPRAPSNFRVAAARQLWSKRSKKYRCRWYVLGDTCIDRFLAIQSSPFPRALVFVAPLLAQELDRPTQCYC